MFLDMILSEIIIVSILGCAGVIFVYLRKKFTCQNQIQDQLDILNTKVNAIIKIYIIILQQTHPEKVIEFKKLLDLATND